jgi:hypothetical protein
MIPYVSVLRVGLLWLTWNRIHEWVQWRHFPKFFADIFYPWIASWLMIIFPYMWKEGNEAGSKTFPIPRCYIGCLLCRLIRLLSTWCCAAAFFLGKWRSSFAGNSDGKMNVQSACAVNTRYNLRGHDSLDMWLRWRRQGILAGKSNISTTNNKSRHWTKS